MFGAPPQTKISGYTNDPEIHQQTAHEIWKTSVLRHGHAALLCSLLLLIFNIPLPCHILYEYSFESSEGETGHIYGCYDGNMECLNVTMINCIEIHQPTVQLLVHGYQLAGHTHMQN